MNEKIDRVQKALEGFKEIHQKNSKEDRSRGYRELAPNGEYNNDFWSQKNFRRDPR